MRENEIVHSKYENGYTHNTVYLVAMAKFHVGGLLKTWRHTFLSEFRVNHENIT